MAAFHLLNFGCRASQADGPALKAQLLQASLEEAPGAESSDLAALNTCTVTAVVDANVRRVVRRILTARTRAAGSWWPVATRSGNCSPIRLEGRRLGLLINFDTELDQRRNLSGRKQTTRVKTSSRERRQKAQSRKKAQ